MSQKSGVAEEIIRLPKGGGAIPGIGESFSPDLHTGTGNLSVPIALPPGRGGATPTLGLTYSTGNPNGAFGLGWGLGIAQIRRRTTPGVPRYRDASTVPAEHDTFELTGTDQLVALPGGTAGETHYRPRTESLYADVARLRRPDSTDASEDGWRARLPDGSTQVFGGLDAGGELACVRDPAATGRPRIFCWLLNHIEDSFGNRIEYLYERDPVRHQPQPYQHDWDQVYLSEIRYCYDGPAAQRRYLVSVKLRYEPRPDPYSDYKAGFEIRTVRRCRAIEVSTHPASGDTAVRTHQMRYTAGVNGVSLLDRFLVVGHRGADEAELPPLTFTYAGFDPRRRTLRPVDGPDLPGASLADPNVDLADVTGDGLPDLIEFGGVVRYWRNGGDGHFEHSRPMRDAPGGLRLADRGVQLLDADGDGRVELVTTDGGSGAGGYFRLGADGGWDRRSFQPFRYAPSVPLEGPAVRLVDVTGDGRIDVVHAGASLHCFFNDGRDGWTFRRARAVPRRAAPDFPDVTFDDPRVRWADMTGDGLQDLVMVADGHIGYWPSLGHGDWAPRVLMTGSPRMPYGTDPRRVLLGDVDGDGLADLVLVEDGRVTVWLNQGGGGWGAPVVVTGTPSVSDLDQVRLVDLLGTGVAGVLWSADVSSTWRDRMYFLDLTGGIKPYLLVGVDNHRGATTTVTYTASTRQRLPRRWQRRDPRVTLPFPVQVVAAVEVVDELSRTRLCTTYRYGFGCWDGEWREFCGFGLVEQTDSVVPPEGDRTGLSPPMMTRTWFHQGVTRYEPGRWHVPEFRDEYWSGDGECLPTPPELLQLLERADGATRRTVLRAMRGRVLRTEIYALDGTARQGRPQSVTEQRHTVVVLQDTPDGPVVAPRTVARRTTHWERGEDPLTQVSIVDGYDAHGFPGQETTVALPRRLRRRNPVTAAVVGTIAVDPTTILTTHVRTGYAVPDAGRYLYGRPAHVATFALTDPGGVTETRPDDPAVVVADQCVAALAVHGRFQAALAGWLPGRAVPGAVRLYGHSVYHYDGAAFAGRPAGVVGPYGAQTRIESLVLTSGVLTAAHGTQVPVYLGGTRANPPGAPAGFGAQTGFHRRTLGPGGYQDGFYVDAQRQRFDFQHTGAGVTRFGAVTGMEDSLGHRTEIGLDPDFRLLPVSVTDTAGLTTTVEYDWRGFTPARVTDPNGNATVYRYNPLGLLDRIVTRDRDGNGGTDARPDIEVAYDLHAYDRTRGTPRPQPVYSHTRQRITYASSNLGDDVVEYREYSDGFGRMLQRRARVDEPVFGDDGDNVGLSAEPDTEPVAATARVQPDRVAVTGWQVYDHKGQAVRRYEPRFGTGWGFGADAPGAYLSIEYDHAGRQIGTVAPDGARTRVVFGVPRALDQPEVFDPSPWEQYRYDANDLAAAAAVPAGHRFTPASVTLDGFGRNVAELERTGGDPHVRRIRLDVRSNVLEQVDELGRVAFRHVYDLANRVLRIASIDAGVRTRVLDATGEPIEDHDGRGAVILRTHDRLGRLTGVWARDGAGAVLTRRERLRYGDDGDRAAARDRNALGRLVAHHDEAGLLSLDRYTPAGDVRVRTRRVFTESRVNAGWVTDWDSAAASTALDGTPYAVDVRYDALRRPAEVTYPRDATGRRSVVSYRYGSAGHVTRILLDGAAVIDRVAHNARGQRILVAYGAGTMCRYRYDPRTFQLLRARTERHRYSRTGDVERWQQIAPVLQDLTYTYDPVGNVTGIRDAAPYSGVDPVPGLLARTFTYDPRYRLVEATGRACRGTGRPRPVEDDFACGAHRIPYQSGGARPDQRNAPSRTERYTETYVHDPAGNLRSVRYAAPSGAWLREYGLGDLPPDRWAESPNNRATSLVDAGVPHRYRYDDNGNVVRQNTERHFDWDHTNRLTRFRNQPEGAASPSVSVRYRYDDGGQMVHRSATTGGRTQHSIYIDALFEHCPRNPNGPTSYLHVLDGDRRIAVLRRGPAHPDEAGPPTQYHLSDHLGSSAVVVDDTGAWINREEYFAYGETSYGGYARKRYRFTGRYRDDRSGLSHHGARWYAPWLGRWYSCDPAWAADGLNLYRYARGNPISVVDPTGTMGDPARNLVEEIVEPQNAGRALYLAYSARAAVSGLAGGEAAGALLTATGFGIIAIAALAGATYIASQLIQLEEARAELAAAQGRFAHTRMRLEVYQAEQSGRLTPTQARLLEGNTLPSEAQLERAGNRDRLAAIMAKAAPLHHIATDKNTKSGDRWTVLLQKIFERCGMTLQDKGNLVRIKGHKGPHPPGYHMAIVIDLLSAVLTKEDVARVEKEGLDKVLKEKLDAAGRQQCADNLRSALEGLAEFLKDNPEVLREPFYEAPPPKPPAVKLQSVKP